MMNTYEENTKNYLADKGYLVMYYPDDTVEVFNRQYKHISDSKLVVNSIEERKVLVQIWKDYTGTDNKIGLGKWYKRPEEARDKEVIVCGA
tara:strand:- start:251 stop:523 length:273 start_codon:yes stop_codon:yes gene_type:complete